MLSILDFKHRKRLTPFAKDLLKLPCMQVSATEWPEAQCESAYGEAWRRSYAGLQDADVDQQLVLAELQGSRLDVSHAEDELDVPEAEEDPSPAMQPAECPPACFANQDVYDKPNAYIRSLIDGLPEDERLTTDQTLFMARFRRATTRGSERRVDGQLH